MSRVDSSENDIISDAIAERVRAFANRQHCEGCNFKPLCSHILRNLPLRFRRQADINGCRLSFLTGYDVNPNWNDDE